MQKVEITMEKIRKDSRDNISVACFIQH